MLHRRWLPRPSRALTASTGETAADWMELVVSEESVKLVMYRGSNLHSRSADDLRTRLRVLGNYR